eukprot:s1281_g1.t1
MPTAQSESKGDRIQSATVDSAPARNDQESSKHCDNGDTDQAAPSKETEWKAAEDAIIAYALAAYKAKLGQGPAPEALSLELLSTVPPAYPLARLSFNLTSLSQIWKFSVCRCIVGWVAEGWSVEDIYERVTWKAWDFQKATTSSAARTMLKENKLVKGQLAFGPVQRMELEQQLHELREEEQMPGPERLKAEEKVDGADQMPPNE